jgi:hypothetical protein
MALLQPRHPPPMLSWTLGAAAAQPGWHGWSRGRQQQQLMVPCYEHGSPVLLEPPLLQWCWHPHSSCCLLLLLLLLLLGPAQGGARCLVHVAAMTAGSPSRWHLPVPVWHMHGLLQ